MSRSKKRSQDESHGRRRTGSDGFDIAWEDYSYASPIDSAETRSRVANLLNRLRTIDDLRSVLEREGGSREDVETMTGLLRDEVEIEGRHSVRSVKLNQPHEVRWALEDLVPGCVFDVRRLESALPGYYLARECSDRWRQGAVIVEDLHRSVGYPISDERFVTRMQGGRERAELRLSHFRREMSQVLDTDIGAQIVDERLFEVGASVLESCWHEDQWLAFALAEVLEVEELRFAVELLYLCLGGDLYDLRTRASPALSTFFDAVYPQPALARLTSMLPSLETDFLERLRRDAELGYQRIKKVFANLLATEVRWGPRFDTVPLWKPVYANLPRLEVVARRLRVQKKVQKSLYELRTVATGVCEQISAT